VVDASADGCQLPCLLTPIGPASVFRDDTMPSTAPEEYPTDNDGVPPEPASAAPLSATSASAAPDASPPAPAGIDVDVGSDVVVGNSAPPDTAAPAPAVPASAVSGSVLATASMWSTSSRSWSRSWTPST
jgi:hypothetical protein